MATTRLRTRCAPLLVVVALVSACGPATTPPDEVSTPPGPTATATNDATSKPHPDVLEVDLDRTGDTWSVAVTISSPYDTPERYADAFRVLAPDGTELGVRELLHDHAGEQPFTRSLDDLVIPDDVDEVTVEGRDLVNGWGGDTTTIDVPR